MTDKKGQTNEEIVERIKDAEENYESLPHIKLREPAFPPRAYLSASEIVKADMYIKLVPGCEPNYVSLIEHNHVVAALAELQDRYDQLGGYCADLIDYSHSKEDKV